MADPRILPIVLIRGFDFAAGNREDPYYGWNEGTVYPYKLGENFIYEGMVVKFLKTDIQLRTKSERKPSQRIRYQDATNVITYKPAPSGKNTISASDRDAFNAMKGRAAGTELSQEEKDLLVGDIFLDPTLAKPFAPEPGVEFRGNNLWVFRYYDMGPRDCLEHAHALRKLIRIIKEVTGAPAVNLLCHSMGGVIVRALLAKVYPSPDSAKDDISKIVTLGTPHRGILFQVAGLSNLPVETEWFNRSTLATRLGLDGPDSLGKISLHFPADDVLCVVGTNHRAYNKVVSGLSGIAAFLSGRTENRSDGLVTQESASLEGANRAYVHKPHTGPDSLITARESFELATRFFFGDVNLKLKVNSFKIAENNASRTLVSKITDWLDGRPEVFVGFSVKPRDLDFYLNYQKPDSENCFGPFDRYDLTTKDFTLPYEGEEGVVFEGFLNAALAKFDEEDGKGTLQNLVFRLDIYAGERDQKLLNHSDTELVQAQTLVVVTPTDQEPEIELLSQLNSPKRYKFEYQQPEPGYEGPLRYRLQLGGNVIDGVAELDLSLTIHIRRPTS